MFGSYQLHLVATQQGTLWSLLPQFGAYSVPFGASLRTMQILLVALFLAQVADQTISKQQQPPGFFSCSSFQQLRRRVERVGVCRHRCRPSPEVPMRSHVASPLIVVAFPLQHFLAAEDGETHTGHRIVTVTVVHKQVSHLTSANHNRIHSNYSKFSTSSSHYHDQHGLHSLPSWL